MRKYVYSFLASVVLLAYFSCEPIYIPDPIDPRLPKYTEEGYNVAGALVNNNLWKSQRDFSFLKSDPNNPRIDYFLSADSLVMIFSGETDNITFSFKGLGITTLKELTKLNSMKLSLDGLKSSAFLSDYFEECESSGLGQIYFRSVKFAEQSQRVVLSGTFGFDQNDPVCGKHSVTYGRFDYRVDNITIY